VDSDDATSPGFIGAPLVENIKAVPGVFPTPEQRSAASTVRKAAEPVRTHPPKRDRRRADYGPPALPSSTSPVA